MSGMLRSTGGLAAATLLSRILGLVREMAYARFMGNGWVASAFLLAFQIPNLFRRLLGEGALSAAFIPIFKEKEKTEGEAAMWQTANAVISGLIIAAGLVVGLVVAGVSLVLAHGSFGAQTRLMLELLRVMFPYAMLVCFAAICIGMLNALGRFFIPALGACLLNILLIASVMFWAPRIEGGLPRQIYALAYGVLLAGLAQAFFQVPSLVASGWRFRWICPWRNPTVIQVLRRMGPTTLGAAAYQLNLLITQGFAFYLGDSVVASFQYAVRLMELPQGLFGVSLATYLLPTLSGLAAERRFDVFRGTLLQGLSYLIVFNTLAGILLLALAEPIVRLLFEGGAFQASATASVASALVFLAPGLVALSASSILARAFYAVGDTRVPMQIAIFCLGINTVLSLLFSLALRERGLALANTLTATLHVLLLGYALRRRMPKIDFAELWRECRKVLVLGLGIGIGVWLLAEFCQQSLGTASLAVRLTTVFVPAGLGSLVFFAAGRAARIKACMELFRAVRLRGPGRRG